MRQGLYIRDQVISDTAMLKGLIAIMLMSMSIVMVLMYFANIMIVQAYQPTWFGTPFPMITKLTVEYVGGIAVTSVFTSVAAGILIFRNSGPRTILVCFALLIGNILLASLMAFAYMLPWIESPGYMLY